MKAIGRVQSIAIAAVLIIAIAVGGWIGLVKPAKAKVTALNDQAATQESANSSLQLQLTVLRSLAKKLPEQQAELLAIKSKVPDHVELANLLRQLVIAAKDSGVTLTGLTPQQPVALPAAPGISSVDLTMTFTGGYAETEQFTSALEGLSRTLMVKDFTLASATGSGGSASASSSSSTISTDGDTIAATFNGRVLVKDDTPAAATTPSAAAATTTPAKS